ncbi:diguanylate cyclase (GGDEF) domain-containing protein [Faunimonas pinastri]|uniref:diguanylate cyclase n=1 Tax=Faunimonas pinastri TaxID=1855383 RepID=A0A1H9C2E4_9HYPH|nr:GGDEF domain-containing protein [Faunimonas pinastri]SEP95445.1 diguanylate cyclase (GGDEF) domain-containing protein [Faunimonas pinastri]
MSFKRHFSMLGVQTERDLHVYVAKTACFCVGAALAVDVANQLIFFNNWTEALRSWAITVIACTAISLPVLYSIGRANLRLYRTKAEVEQLSLTDPLTGLPNRRALFNYAEEAAGMTLVLLIFDVDRFKAVNDAFGHRIGDAVLVSIGRRMQEHLDKFGLVGRLGGEEFAFLSRDSDPHPALDNVEAFCQQLAGIPIVADGHSVSVTVSAGAAMGISIDELYSQADRALYAAKNAGRNRICLAPDLQKLIGGAAAITAGE